MGFWKKVEGEIDFRGISRKELSAQSGVPMTTINRAMERDSKPYAHDAIKIARALGLPLDYLLEIPQIKTSSFSSAPGKLQQELYKKYFPIIESLENIPSEKQKIALEIIKKFSEMFK